MAGSLGDRWSGSLKPVHERTRGLPEPLLGERVVRVTFSTGGVEGALVGGIQREASLEAAREGGVSR